MTLSRSAQPPAKKKKKKLEKKKRLQTRYYSELRFFFCSKLPLIVFLFFFFFFTLCDVAVLFASIPLYPLRLHIYMYMIKDACTSELQYLRALFCWRQKEKKKPQ